MNIYTMHRNCKIFFIGFIVLCSSIEIRPMTMHDREKKSKIRDFFNHKKLLAQCQNPIIADGETVQYLIKTLQRNLILLELDMTSKEKQAFATQALWIALKNANVNQVTYALEWGADVNARTTNFQEDGSYEDGSYTTVTYEAICTEELDILKTILKYKPNLEDCYYSGDFSKYRLSAIGIVNTLLEQNPNIENVNRCSIATWAAICRVIKYQTHAIRIELLMDLLNKKPYKASNSTLFYAAQLGGRENGVFELILEQSMIDRIYDEGIDNIMPTIIADVRDAKTDLDAFLLKNFSIMFNVIAETKGNTLKAKTKISEIIRMVDAAAAKKGRYIPKDNKTFDKSWALVNSKNQDIKISIKEGELYNVGGDVIVDAANNNLNPAATVSLALYNAANASTGIDHTEWAAVKTDWEAKHGRNFKDGDALFNTSSKALMCVDKNGNVVPSTTLGAKKIHLIHAVGPVGIQANTDQAIKDQLRDAYIHSLEVADQNGFSKIVFPAISTGAFGGDKVEAGKIEIDAILSYLKTHEPTNLKEIILLVWQGYKTNQEKQAFFDSYDQPMKKRFGQ